MPNERELNLNKYEISRNKFKELKYFCRQYREKSSQLRSICEISSPTIRTGGSGRGADKTSSLAIKKAQLEYDIKIIEESAKEAAEDIYKYIISNVADGIPYKYLGVPCGQRYFYEKRQKFFYLLSKKRG